MRDDSIQNKKAWEYDAYNFWVRTAADAAGVSIGFEVCDILEIEMGKYSGYFDVVFMKGDILHCFHDINKFMKIMYALLKSGGV